MMVLIFIICDIYFIFADYRARARPQNSISKPHRSGLHARDLLPATERLSWLNSRENLEKEKNFFFFSKIHNFFLFKCVLHVVKRWNGISNYVRFVNLYIKAITIIVE